MLFRTKPPSDMGLRRDFDTAATTGLAPCRSAGATEGGRLSVCIGFQKTAGNAERPTRRKSATGSYLGAGDAWSYPIGGSSLLGNFLISNAFEPLGGCFFIACVVIHGGRLRTAYVWDYWGCPHLRADRLVSSHICSHQRAVTSGIQALWQAFSAGLRLNYQVLWDGTSKPGACSRVA